MELQFKVAMDNEQKKAGNIEEVTLNVGFDGVTEEVIQKAALAHMVVAWQNQIRSHWTEFKDGKLPTEITFGVPLFAPKRVAAKSMTQDAVLDYMKGLEPEALAEMISKMQE